MGPALVILGVVVFIAIGPLSMSEYKRTNPSRHASGQPPRPGSGDVPTWISKLYFVAVALVIAGIVMWVSG
jgi:hypothetical protein